LRLATVLEAYATKPVLPTSQKAGITSDHSPHGFFYFFFRVHHNGVRPRGQGPNEKAKHEKKHMRKQHTACK
jgi:hypothetical protein